MQSLGPRLGELADFRLEGDVRHHPGKPQIYDALGVSVGKDVSRPLLLPRDVTLRHAALRVKV